MSLTCGVLLQDYPDNYTDTALFLQGLVLNAHVQPRAYWRVVLDSAAVCQQLSIVALAASVSVHVYQGRISLESLLLVDAVLLVAGVACVQLTCSPSLTLAAL